MKYLIATTFYYTARFWDDEQPKTLEGNYLGRKPASERTIRRFLNAKAKKYCPQFRLLSLTVHGSYETHWIHK